MTTWNEAPMIFVPIVQCPRCKHQGHITVRSMPVESDGSRAKRCVCRRCSMRFVVVSEPDESEFLEALPKFGRERF